MTTVHKKPSSKTTEPEVAVAQTESTEPTPAVAGTAPPATASPATPLATQRQPGDRQAILGIKRNFSAVAVITLMTRDFSPAQLVALYQQRVDAADKTDESERTWHDDVAAERVTEAALAPVRKAFETYLAARYGAKSNKMKEFGVAPPRQRRKPDTATLAQAQKQAAATRVARGTVGKREKAKIKGVVPVETEVATPAEAGTAPAVAAGAPATTNGSGTGGAKS